MPLAAPDALKMLRSAEAHHRLAHAYLITGAEGSGKRPLASELCHLVTGPAPSGGDPLLHPDVHVIEPESKSRRIVVEQIREMEHELHMRSALGGRKVGIIFDADRLQVQAANAFLKTLEEPPANTHLILVTALPDQLLETILSRCIEVPLLSSVAVEPTARQRAFAGILQQATGQKLSLPGVFGLVREFQGLLSAAKDESRSRGDAEMKAEAAKYKQMVDAKWLEEREAYFKAIAESRYVAERGKLLETLEAWWADVLRFQTMQPEESATESNILGLPESASYTEALAKEYTQEEALQRFQALATLREQLGNSGIQEGLAIECAFLKAFGA